MKVEGELDEREVATAKREEEKTKSSDGTMEGQRGVHQWAKNG